MSDYLKQQLDLELEINEDLIDQKFILQNELNHYKISNNLIGEAYVIGTEYWYVVGLKQTPWTLEYIVIQIKENGISKEYVEEQNFPSNRIKINPKHFMEIFNRKEI